MANKDNSRPKPIYIAYLDEKEVKLLFMIRDTYGVGDSILEKVEAGAYPKGPKDPVNILFAEYKAAAEDVGESNQDRINRRMGVKPNG